MPIRLLTVLLASTIGVACGTVNRDANTTQASSTRAAQVSASPSVPMASPSFGPPTPSSAVAVIINATRQDHYSLGLVKADGTILTSLSVARRTMVTVPSPNGPATSTDLPYVSTTRDRVYYLAGDSELHWIDPASGASSVAMTLPGSATAHAAFAVSPDDSQIAVSVIDYSSGTRNATLRLLVGPLGGPLAPIFSSTTDFVWPVGWHGGHLVLATDGNPPFWTTARPDLFGNPYGARSFHVADASTADRLAVVGTPDELGGCYPTGLLTIAGTACYLSTSYGGQSGGYGILNWQGNRYFGPRPASWSAAAAVSPELGSSNVVVCCEGNGAQGHFLLSGADQQTATPLTGTQSEWACWLDKKHVLTAAVDRPAGVLDLSSGRVASPNFRGYCAGVVPNDLG